MNSVRSAKCFVFAWYDTLFICDRGKMPWRFLHKEIQPRVFKFQMLHDAFCVCVCVCVCGGGDGRPLHRIFKTNYSLSHPALRWQAQSGVVGQITVCSWKFWGKRNCQVRVERENVIRDYRSVRAQDNNNLTNKKTPVGFTSDSTAHASKTAKLQ